MSVDTQAHDFLFLGGQLECPCHLGKLVKPRGLILTPALKNLGPYKARHIIDPYDLRPLSRNGKRVPDIPYWQRMIRLGAVVVDDDL